MFIVYIRSRVLFFASFLMMFLFSKKWILDWLISHIVVQPPKRDKDGWFFEESYIGSVPYVERRYSCTSHSWAAWLLDWQPAWSRILVFSSILNLMSKIGFEFEVRQCIYVCFILEFWLPDIFLFERSNTRHDHDEYITESTYREATCSPRFSYSWFRENTHGGMCVRGGGTLGERMHFR